MGAAVQVLRESQADYGAAQSGMPLDGEWAHEALVSLAARRAADDVAMLEPLLVAEESKVHELLGMGSFAEYCSRLFGWGGRQTRERLRVARAMRELPAIRARWAAGELSYTVVRELTRVATPAVEADWLAWVSAGGVRRTGHEVQRVVARHRPGARPCEPPAPFEEQRVRIVLEVSGSEAARLSEVRAEAVRRLGESVDDETLAKMLFDAFLRSGAEASDAGVAPNQVALTVCERCAATERQAGPEGLVQVDPIVGETALCDAQVLRPGERAAQTVRPAIRRAVLQRDEGTCAVPGCRLAAFVEVHHVDRRTEGGSHDEGNLVTLCSVHHEAAHRGRLTIRAEGEGWRFERADGTAYGSLGVAGEVGRCGQQAERFEDLVARSGSEAVARSERDARLRLLRRRGPVAPRGQTGAAGMVDAVPVDAGPDETGVFRVAPRGQVEEPAVAAGSEGTRDLGVSVSPPEPPRRPRVPAGLHEQVVGLLTSTGYRPAESRELVRRAIAGDELPIDRVPTTEELLRASFRAGNVPRSRPSHRRRR